MSKINQNKTYPIDKVRIYDAGKKYKGYLDRYSVVFLFSKCRQKKENFRGLYIGCAPSGEDSYIKCYWTSIKIGEYINSNSLYLGKKVRLENLPMGFQEAIQALCETFY